MRRERRGSQAEKEPTQVDAEGSPAVFLELQADQKDRRMFKKGKFGPLSFCEWIIFNLLRLPVQYDDVRPCNIFNLSRAQSRIVSGDLRRSRPLHKDARMA